MERQVAPHLVEGREPRVLAEDLEDLGSAERVVQHLAHRGRLELRQILAHQVQELLRAGLAQAFEVRSGGRCSRCGVHHGA